jgi:hypothetical protein
MKYSVEHKVSHREWDEVTISAEDFLDNREKFLDEDGDFIGMPVFNFTNGKIWCDEFWSINKDRTISISSHSGGIVDWSEKNQSYIRTYYGSERNLGKIISVEFNLTEELKKKLDAP